MAQGRIWIILEMFQIATWIKIFREEFVFISNVVTLKEIMVVFASFDNIAKEIDRINRTT